MTRWLLRLAWILSALIGLALLRRGIQLGSPWHLGLAALALVNANLGFAATAIVGRLEILIERTQGTPALKGLETPPP